MPTPIMPTMDEALIQDIMRVFIFENWARFYHATQQGGQTWLAVPENVLDACRSAHPDLAPLLDATNNTPISYESCAHNVGEFVCRLLDGQKYPPGKVEQTLGSKAFKIQLHMFSLWQRGHETYLDQHALSFDDWLEMFANWLAMDEVQTFQARLAQSPESGDTAH